VKRIHPDAIRAKMVRKLDQRLNIGEITDAPITHGADSVKLDSEEPAAIEVAAERALRRDDQGYFFDLSASVRYLKPVCAERKVLRPEDGVLSGLAFSNKLLRGNNLPAHRTNSCPVEFRTRRAAGPDHHRPSQEPALFAWRKRVEDDPQRRLIRHALTALTVGKFGLNSQVLGLGEDVHSARSLIAATRGAAKFAR
jgi:hypothetical protein